MSRRDGNVGDIPEVTADEDFDPDTLTAMVELGRARPAGRRSARQLLEDMREAEEVSDE